MVDKPIPKFELDEKSDLPIWVQIRDRFVYLIKAQPANDILAFLPQLPESF